MLYNVREYHRPTDLDEAIRLLQREDVRTAVLGGGVTLVGQGRPDVEAVVDLDGLGLGTIEREGNALHLGATVRIQTLVEELGDVAGGLLSRAAYQVAGWNIRNAATLGGLLASGDVHSPLSVALAALGAQVTVYDGTGYETHPWAELSTRIREEGLPGRIITQIALELSAGIGSGYEQVGRTPADIPIVCAAAVAYPSNDSQIKTRTAIGGLLHDLLVVEQSGPRDQPESALEGLDQEITAAHTPDTAYADYRGSAEYRIGVAPVLARRALSAAIDRLA
ncbi:MAG TPA: hypothetical protein ENI95_09910 [Chloroflexi bacterium]|nr:hypothetical protein [Chloroflexota bacterium]